MRTPPTEKPILLTSRAEEILKAVHCYRYVTALDITHLFYAPSSLTHVREILSRLAGGHDYQDRQYLFRFPLPHTRIGNTEKIYTLGAKGRLYLQSLGMDVAWYFRPAETSSLTYQHLTHSLTLTRFLIAGQVYCRGRDDLKLPQVRTEYTLKPAALRVAIQEGNQTRSVKVVPDAWLNFELLTNGKHRDWSPVLLEIDRGTEQQKYFKRHLAARLAFVTPNGAYHALFGTNAVTIAYATTGGGGRLTNLLAWTEEVLAKLGMTHWAGIFRFCRLPQPGEYDPVTLFQAASWYQPMRKDPLPLLS